MTKTITTWIAQCEICGKGIHGADVRVDGSDQLIRNCEHDQAGAMYEPVAHGSGPREGTVQLVSEYRI